MITYLFLVSGFITYKPYVKTPDRVLLIAEDTCQILSVWYSDISK